MTRTWGDAPRPGNRISGGTPQQRPDQMLQPASRAGTGPAPQSQIFIGKLIVVSGTGPNTGIFFYNGTPKGPVPGPANPPILAITNAAKDPYGNPVTASAITDGGMPILVYSGPPAAGNLIASISPVQTADSPGNTVYQAIASYQAASGFYAQLISGGLLWGTTGNQPQASPSILGNATSTGAGITLTSGIGSAGGLGSRAVVLTLTDAAVGHTGQVVVSNLTPSLGHGLAPLEVEGTIAATSLLSMTIPGLLASWQAAALNANFAAGGTSPRYQYEGMNGGRVRLSGAVNITGAVAANTTMFTMAAGYVPARQFGFVTVTTSAGAVLDNAVVTVDTSGNVILNPATGAGKFVLLDGICFELD
jgi:hypothetical protein